MKPRLSTIAVRAGAWAVLGLAASAATIEMRDIEGRRLAPLVSAGPASVLFFVATECPISNSYAPDIQQLCGQVAARGIGCSLIYEDVPPDRAAVLKHLEEFGYRAAGLRAGLDADHRIATAAGASVTPQAVIIDAAGMIRYRGRIDNRYAAIGKPRQRATTHDLSDALEAVLTQRPVATRETEAFGCAIVPADRLNK